MLFSPLLASAFDSAADAQTIAILHNFSDGTVPNDGMFPQGGLIQGRDGNFYGITIYGGSTAIPGMDAIGDGTVYRMTPNGVITNLHSFGDSSVPHDGSNPWCALVQGSDGNFYGTTAYGGSTSENAGTVFEMTPSGTVTILHNFLDGTTAGDGEFPASALVQGADGNFYGTTEVGGVTGGHGTVFKITPAGTESVLHTFGDGTVQDDGILPFAALVQGMDGSFYGTTEFGGSTVDADPNHGGFGTVYKITPSGAFTILHDFRDGTVLNDGSVPYAGLVLGNDGIFYGNTSAGGSTAAADPNHYGFGTVFKMTSTGSVTILHSFDSSNVASDGTNPEAALIQGSDGNFYGTTAEGQSTGEGTVFMITPSGTETILYTFGDGTVTNDGEYPNAALIQGMDGSIYGTTYAGGDSMVSNPDDFQYGTVFKLPSWRAADIAGVLDGSARILRARNDGTASVWAVKNDDTKTAIGPAYGPFPGWTAKAVSAASDGTAHILWARGDGAAGLWTLNAADVETAIGPTYGPYSDNHGAWTAKNMGVSSRHVFQVLWTRTDGAAGLWNFDAADVAVDVGPVYGPYRHFAAASLDTGGSTAQVLWVRSDRAAGIWSIATDDFETVVGSVYGPF